MNLVVCIALIKNKAYASLFTILQGIILMGWIIIQVLMVKEINMLHISIFAIGALFVLGGWIMTNNIFTYSTEYYADKTLP